MDTSGDACSVALHLDGHVSATHEIAPRRHTERILPMIDALLAQAGIQGSSLDAIAFGKGPGSFTGVRIACGVCQGLAWAWDIPTLAVSSLAGLAQTAATRHEWVAAGMDARMGEVYWGLFRRNKNGLMEPLAAERVCPPDQIGEAMERSWHGVGSAWKAYGETLSEHVRCASRDAEALPSAAAMLPLAEDLLRQGKQRPARQAIPEYLRDQVAKAKA